MMVLSINNLNVAVKSQATGEQHRLLNDISCNIAAGEILGVIGANGAGKSTLIKAICGELAFTGQIDMPNIERSVPQRARQMAVLPQFSLLNFPYQVWEVVALGRIPHQTSHRYNLEVVDQVLELTDIAYLKYRRYTQLSGGEKQRVQLARVLAQIWDQPTPKTDRLLLLDEPTSALDIGHQHDLMKVIQSFAEKGVAVLMVMHDINLAAQYSDHLLALLCSERLAYGTPQQVVTRENIQKLFGLDAHIMQHPTNHKPHVIGA